MPSASFCFLLSFCFRKDRKSTRLNSSHSGGMHGDVDAFGDDSPLRQGAQNPPELGLAMAAASDVF